MLSNITSNIKKFTQKIYECVANFNFQAYSLWNVTPELNYRNSLARNNLHLENNLEVMHLIYRAKALNKSIPIRIPKDNLD